MSKLRVRSMFMKGYIEACELISYDPTKLLAKHHIEVSQIDDFYASFSIENACSIIEETAEITKRKDFGMIMGSTWNPDMAGPFSSVLIMCRTYDDLIKNAMRFFNAVNIGFSYRLFKKKDYTSATFNISAPKYYQSTQVIELIIARYLIISRFFLGQDWNPSNVIFKHKRSANEDAYMRVFGKNTVFNASDNGLVFRNAELNLKTNIEKKYYQSKINDYVDQLVAAPRISYKEKLMLLIAETYGRNEAPEFNKICKTLSVSRRTLQNRLALENTSYRKILREVQSEISRNLINQERMGIAEISDILGFSEVSAFSRAFKRWHGVSPTEYCRMTHKDH